MVRYLFRLDDACPTMNHVNWSRIINIFRKYDIKPIIAVIPNNKDLNNIVDAPNDDFWNEVIRWDKLNYAIALHGYDHVYTTTNSGIIGINKFSEFAGVDYDIQKEKIIEGCSIFNKKGIKPKIWIAPGHSFDKNTLKVLKKYSEINIISDGFSVYPYKDGDFFWVPSQLWGPCQKEEGVWTICYHPNTMIEDQFNRLEDFLLKNRSNCSSIEDIYDEFHNRRKSFSDTVYQLKVSLVRMVKRARKIVNIKK
jgi:predicted deacetylase